MRPGNNGFLQDLGAIAKTQSGRQALFSGGALIAGAYMGYMGPELISAMHAGLAYWSAQYPFMNPAILSDALWSGAQYCASSVLDYLGQAVDMVDLDISAQLRDAVNSGREFLSRHGERVAEASRNFVEQSAMMLGDKVAQAVEIVGSAASSGWGFVKEHWQSVTIAIGIAKEALDYFDIGKRVYDRWICRAGKETRASTEKAANLEVNTAIAGVSALDKAETELVDETSREKSARRSVTANQGDILWISDQLHRSIRKDISAEASSEQDGRVGNSKYNFDRLLNAPDIHIERSRFSHVDLVGETKLDKSRPNWDESPRSSEALSRLKKTPRTQFDVQDPMGFRKGAGEVDDESDLLAKVAFSEKTIGQSESSGLRLM